MPATLLPTTETEPTSQLPTPEVLTAEPTVETPPEVQKELLSIELAEGMDAKYQTMLEGALRENNLKLSPDAMAALCGGRMVIANAPTERANALAEYRFDENGPRIVIYEGSFDRAIKIESHQGIPTEKTLAYLIGHELSHAASHALANMNQMEEDFARPDNTGANQQVIEHLKKYTDKNNCPLMRHFERSFTANRAEKYLKPDSKVSQWEISEEIYVERLHDFLRSGGTNRADYYAARFEDINKETIEEYLTATGVSPDDAKAQLGDELGVLKIFEMLGAENGPLAPMKQDADFWFDFFTSKLPAEREKWNNFFAENALKEPSEDEYTHLDYDEWDGDDYDGLDMGMGYGGGGSAADQPSEGQGRQKSGFWDALWSFATAAAGKSGGTPSPAQRR